MYNLLKTRGYKGRKNIEDVIKWLNKNKIYVDLRTVWSNDDVSIIGYRATIFVHPYNSAYNSPISKNYHDALELAIYKLIDYLPKN